MMHTKEAGGCSAGHLLTWCWWPLVITCAPRKGASGLCGSLASCLRSAPFNLFPAPETLTNDLFRRFISEIGLHTHMYLPATSPH